MANCCLLEGDLKNIIAGLVSSGRYRCESDVIREAVRLLEERDSRMALNAALGRGPVSAGRTPFAGGGFGDRRDAKEVKRADAYEASRPPASPARRARAPRR